MVGAWRPTTLRAVETHSRGTLACLDLGRGRLPVARADILLGARGREVCRVITTQGGRWRSAGSRARRRKVAVDVHPDPAFVRAEEATLEFVRVELSVRAVGAAPEGRIGATICAGRHLRPFERTVGVTVPRLFVPNRAPAERPSGARTRAVCIDRTAVVRRTCRVARSPCTTRTCAASSGATSLAISFAPQQGANSSKRHEDRDTHGSKLSSGRGLCPHLQRDAMTMDHFEVGF